LKKGFAKGKNSKRLGLHMRVQEKGKGGVTIVRKKRLRIERLPSTELGGGQKLRKKGS